MEQTMTIPTLMSDERQALPAIMLPLPVAPVRASAIFFVNGQLVFAEQRGESWASKFVRAEDVRAAFSGNEVDSGWLPAGVVRTGSNAKGPWYVYSTPAQLREIWLEDEHLTVPLPRLVLLGSGNGFHLWALKTDHFDPEAMACVPPFPNVHDDGKICWGSNTPPLADPTQARQPWELFFAAPFNNHLVQNRSRSQKEDVHKALRAVAGKKKYPADDLVAIQQKIGAVINRTLEA